MIAVLQYDILACRFLHQRAPLTRSFLFYIFVTQRKRALRERGLHVVSSSDGRMAFLVTTRTCGV